MIWADLGLVALRQGEYETARRYYEKARPLAEKSHDPALWQTVLGQLGTIELRIGDAAAALLLALLGDDPLDRVRCLFRNRDRHE